MALFREQQFIRPRRKQSFLFKVKEVIDLENYLEDEDHCNIDRYIVGCILFAIFSRARFGDLRFTERCIVDLDALLSRASKLGTSRCGAAGNKVGLPLPLVAPVKGFSKYFVGENLH